MSFIEQAQQMKKKAEAERQEIRDKTNVELLEDLERAKTKGSHDKSHEDFIKELYKRAIDNIRISEWERIKINKHNFEDKDEVIDILLYVVGKMAQDPIFYKLNVSKLKDHTPIYNDKI